MCGVPGLYPQSGGWVHVFVIMERMKALPPKAANSDSQRTLRKHLYLRFCNGGHEESAAGYACETGINLASQPCGGARRSCAAAYFSQKTGVRTYIVHISTKEAMEAIQRDKHAKLSVETTSPYLCLDTESDVGVYAKDASTNPGTGE